MRRRIRIRCKYALGDVVVLTAAVRDIARSFPGAFDISVDTRSPDVWLHNPYIYERIDGGEIIDCDDALIDRAGKTGKHYIQTYLDLLNERLGTKAQLSELRGDIHLSEQERSWYSEIWSLCGREVPYWLISSSGKFDLPIKWWDHRRYQQVVDALRGKIQFVQVGTWGNHHPPLEGAIDLRGKTSVRDLIHLVHHADGVLCGVTSLMHLAAAVPTRGPERCAIIVAGNREPPAWERYPGHVYLTSEVALACGNCWSNRVDPKSQPRKGVCSNVRSELPVCLDDVTSDRVIAAFQRLHVEGRVRYLNEHEIARARRAIKVARARSDFDVHNINPLNAPQKAAEFIDSIPAYPDNRFEGRGITICAGGARYFAQAWVCLRMLRQVGCELPVEVWHLGDSEMDSRMAQLLTPLNAKAINARALMRKYPMRNPLGWELKCYSVLHSGFGEVLSLDADNVPIADPTYLFDTAEYARTGAIFWPDYRRLRRMSSIWTYCGVRYRSEPEFESGQMVINKERCWKALNLAWWYNDHSEFFYRHIHGDKDTFHMAWRKIGTDYAMPPYPIESLEGVMCQHDFHGRRLFQHRNSHKWTFFGDNKRIDGFRAEEDCLRHLEALRKLWDGRINGRREFSTYKDSMVRSDTIDEDVFRCVAAQNEYRLPQSLKERDVVLDIGGHIGSFARACHDRGSREIHCFEPHPENFEVATKNVGALEGVHLYHAAVLGSAGFVRWSGFPKDKGKQNTGGVVVERSESGAAAFGINDLLLEHGYVRLLKLDCEGSEWSILPAIRDWERIDAICGEYHPCAADPLAELSQLLRPHFRFVRIEKPNDEGLGKFWASHIRGWFAHGDIRHKGRAWRGGGGAAV